MPLRPHLDRLEAAEPLEDNSLDAFLDGLAATLDALATAGEELDALLANLATGTEEALAAPDIGALLDSLAAAPLDGHAFEGLAFEGLAFEGLALDPSPVNPAPLAP